MRIKILTLGTLIVTALALSGCARHVVAEPDQVDRLNDDGWTIHSQDADAPEEP
ncbi:hypothetical protein [Salinisphaera sp. PC39]|uniref:hypothetical protein n=1 Tax=Salinisphaera sp. PC39 TaxID=1304156 RepID=UPI00334255AE